MRFQKGNKYGRGGPREGSGRPFELQRRRLRRFVWSEKMAQFLEDAMLGKEVDVRITKFGVVKCPPPVSVRKDVWESVVDRVDGKPLDISKMSELERKTGLTPVVVMLPPRKKEGKKKN
jgi:hypothetical protein